MLTKLFPSFIEETRSEIVFPFKGPMKYELVMLPFIFNPFEIAYLLPFESKSTTGLPFSPDILSCL